MTYPPDFDHVTSAASAASAAAAAGNVTAMDGPSVDSSVPTAFAPSGMLLPQRPLGHTALLWPPLALDFTA